jgi:hypothetical protein
MGQVKILTVPGKYYMWPIGTGTFTDVYKGEYVRDGTIGAPPVSRSVQSVPTHNDMCRFWLR